MKICILGLGYIGLPTAAMIAASGYEVVGVDTNRQRVEALQSGGVNSMSRALQSWCLPHFCPVSFAQLARWKPLTSM